MKLRLDQYLCQNGLVASRERAKALIMAGVVLSRIVAMSFCEPRS